MLKAILLPLLALAGGVGGFFLRRWELSTAFESSGLAIPWAPATVVLVVLSLLLAAVFILLCRGGRNELKAYAEAFAAHNRWLYLAVSAVASACLLLAGLFGLYGEMTGGSPGILRLLLWVLCLVSFFCVALTVMTNFRGQGRQNSMALLAPAYTFCVWLVAAYQKRAADPVVEDYMYELFAIICALLAFYFAAGFSFAKGKIWPSAVFCLLTVYFGIVTLADGRDVGQRLLVMFSVLYQLAAVTILLRNAFVVKPKRLLETGRMPDGAETEQKDETASEE